MVTEVTLELAELRDQFSVCDLEYRTFNEPIHMRFIHQMRARFASTRQEPIVVKWPATWWQHFKQRFFKGWLLKKWPVKCAEKKFDLKLLYPHLKSPLPTELMGRPITLLVQSPNDTRYWNFDPETPMSEVEIRQAARDNPIYNFSDDHCPVCHKPISFHRL